ncbi:hypothetical protein Ahy_A02g009832 isoform B [Arachis hypogaea]|uniref:Uncharacterized protein n=1 Tax=Arachis hypogaea TaxID=3818 RepID=A0A445EIA4_ARAHY|nr:hypothetical protein Ahy_A02g009832 isoform B [Arachis hypogaea]
MCMKYHIGVLVKNSLIKINWCDNRVTTHDLTEDIDKEIVLEKSPEITGKRDRLWFCEDIEIKWNEKVFKEMQNLKTLNITNGWFYCAPKNLSNSLRILEYFPYAFQPKDLSILKLP